MCGLLEDGVSAKLSQYQLIFPNLTHQNHYHCCIFLSYTIKNVCSFTVALKKFSWQIYCALKECIFLMSCLKKKWFINPDMLELAPERTAQSVNHHRNWCCCPSNVIFSKIIKISQGIFSIKKSLKQTLFISIHLFLDFSFLTSAKILPKNKIILPN